MTINITTEQIRRYRIWHGAAREVLGITIGQMGIKCSLDSALIYQPGAFAVEADEIRAWVTSGERIAVPLDCREEHDDLIARLTRWANDPAAMLIGPVACR